MLKNDLEDLSVEGKGKLQVVSGNLCFESYWNEVECHLEVNYFLFADDSCTGCRVTRKTKLFFPEFGKICFWTKLKSKLIGCGASEGQEPPRTRLNGVELEKVQ